MPNFFCENMSTAYLLLTKYLLLVSNISNNTYQSITYGRNTHRPTSKITSALLTLSAESLTETVQEYSLFRCVLSALSEGNPMGEGASWNHSALAVLLMASF